MLTRNGYATLAAKMLTSDAVVDITKVTGDTMTLYPANIVGNFTGRMKTMTQSLGQEGVVLGNGSTPVTIDDITISGTVLTDYSYVADVKTRVLDNGVECTGTYIVTNVGEDDFTVSEIALLHPAYRTSSNANGYYMSERTVLDSPVTVPAGGVGKITYTIRMNYPTA